MEKKICTAVQGKKLFWLCWFAYMISCMGRFNYAAAMAELITAEGFSKSGAGLIGTALFGVYGACQIVTGLIGDKMRPKYLIAFGLAGSTIMNFAMGFASAQPVMLAIWIGNGVFQSCMWSPVARLYAEMLPPDMRRNACSNAAATIPTATILIYAMSAFVIRFYSWRWVFWVPAILMGSMFLLWIWQMTAIERDTAQNGMSVPAAEVHLSTQSGSYGGMLLASGAILIAWAALSHGLLKDGIQSWLPTFLTESFAMTTYASAAASLLLPILTICGVFFTRWLAARYIKNELLGAGAFFLAAILCLSILAIFGFTNSVVSLIALALAGTAMIGANILLMNLIPMRLGAIGRASSMTGFLNCHAYIGSALSSFGVGAAVERWGWNAAIWIWLGFAVFALLCVCGNAHRWKQFCKTIV